MHDRFSDDPIPRRTDDPIASSVQALSRKLQICFLSADRYLMVRLITCEPFTT